MVFTHHGALPFFPFKSVKSSCSSFTFQLVFFFERFTFSANFSEKQILFSVQPVLLELLLRFADFNFLPSLCLLFHIFPQPFKKLDAEFCCFFISLVSNKSSHSPEAPAVFLSPSPQTWSCSPYSIPSISQVLFSCLS